MNINQDQPSMTVEEAIDRFIASGAPEQYGYVVRPYLAFLHRETLLIDEPSAQRYFDYYAQDRKLSYNITSPINQFVAFARHSGLTSIRMQGGDVLAQGFALLLNRYLSSPEAPSRPSTREGYARQLKKYFLWLGDQGEVMSYQTAFDYQEHLRQTKSLSTSRAFLTAIKRLAQWVVLHTDQAPPGSIVTPITALAQIAYLRSV